MSFSSDIKQNLSQTANLKDKQAVKFELLGYLMTANCVSDGKKIKYSTTNEYNINRFNKLLINVGINDFKIDIKGKKYIIEFKVDDSLQFDIDIQDIGAFIRGVFMGSGTINDPEKRYHLEVILSNEENAKFVRNILEANDIAIKQMTTDSRILYLKDGQEISKFLALIGSSVGVLKFEEARVLRDMKNKVNRKVNSETANMQKSIEAGIKQINKIKELKLSGKFDSMPDNLKEIAELRLKNPEASLVELGNMLSKPIGKSGVSHRLNQIMEY